MTPTLPESHPIWLAIDKWSRASAGDRAQLASNAVDEQIHAYAQAHADQRCAVEPTAHELAARMCDAEAARWTKEAQKHLPRYRSDCADRDLERAKLFSNLAKKIRLTQLATPPPVAGDAMVDAYLLAQRAFVEESDRALGRPNAGGLHTNTVKEACRAGLRAAIAAGGSQS